MNFISISPNTLINPKYISYIEQRKTKTGTAIKIGVDGKEFELDMDITEFYKSLEDSGENKQEFGG